MAPTVQEQKQQAHQDAERRRTKVLGELERLVRDRGHTVIVHQQWGRIDVDEHTISTISIDVPRRRSDFSWVCGLRFRITHYHARGKHYPEPGNGWEDAKLRVFAEMIHEEVGVRVRSEQREDEVRSLKEALIHEAAAINAELGIGEREAGEVTVGLNRAFDVRLPREMDGGEIKLLARFARWLEARRTNTQQAFILGADGQVVAVGDWAEESV